jgi:hypothetical protein
MGKVKRIFSPSKPKVDTSAIRAQEQRLKEQEEKLAKEEADRKAQEEQKKKASLSARRGRSGGTSLLTGLETGIAPEDQKRNSLG